MKVVPIRPDLGPVGATDRGLGRSRRLRMVRARTISTKRMTKRDREIGRMIADGMLDDLDVERPVTRGDCQGSERPCPFISCKYNLYLDVSPRTGAIKLNFPDIEPDEMNDSCALDLADAGGATLERVGAALNITCERVRQMEVGVLPHLARSEALRECAPVDGRKPLLRTGGGLGLDDDPLGHRGGNTHAFP